MESKEIQIEPGQILYSKRYLQPIEKITVLRTTATQIVLDGYQLKLRKPFVNGCTAIGSSGWNNAQYYVENDALNEEYLREQTIRYIGNFFGEGRLKSLDTGSLIAIMDLMKNLGH